MQLLPLQELYVFYSECFISTSSVVLNYIYKGEGGNGRVGIFTVSITGITGRMGPQTPLKMITMSWMRPLGGYCAIRINISLSSHIISQHITPSTYLNISHIIPSTYHYLHIAIPSNFKQLMILCNAAATMASSFVFKLWRFCLPMYSLHVKDKKN